MATTLRQHDQHAFLALPENRLAVASIKRLGPHTRRRVIQIVTLCGPPGTGKSRLARELIRSWESKRSDGKIHYLTASEYAAQFAQASTDEAITQFQKRYRTDVTLFVCEDLQAIAGRPETQQQLTALVDDVVSQGGCVLLTTTKMPSEIRGLSTRLSNRIRGGLCVDIPQPGASSRRKLIQHFLTSESFQLTDSEIDEISQKHEFSPRELLGVLQHLKTVRSTQRGQTISTSEALQQLKVTTDFSLPKIASATAKTFGVRVSDMKSPRRSQSISTARQVAMYLARKLTDLNYKTVGEYFGRGNHSTVIHACNKISEGIAVNPVLAHNIETVEKQLLQR